MFQIIYFNSDATLQYTYRYFDSEMYPYPPQIHMYVNQFEKCYLLQHFDLSKLTFNV